MIAREDRGEKRLVAYIVAEGGAVSPAFLRQALRDRLPAYMVPSAFVLLERLPITPNGKVDRRALPAPVEAVAETTAQAMPESDVEERIAAVWREVLGAERVGVTDNFFDVGGHSLLLVRLHSRLQEVLGREISLMELFNHPTVRSQADHLGSGRAPAPAAARASRPKPVEEAGTEGPAGGIAIVGMAGRFPKARDLETFWRNLRDGVEAVSFFSDDELAAAGVMAEELAHPKLVKARGVLEDEALFDADFFEVSPRQAELMDPQLRCFLECSWEALESAGYDPARFPGQIGVYGGSTLSSYLLHNLLSNQDLLQDVGSYQALIATDRDFLTTQVSYKLNLRGPSLTVQTACSTSLVATHLACLALLAGECDMALAGGVSVKVPQVTGYIYQEGGLDSSDGHCRSFDARADGSVYGGGVGVVVLKRLEDALADGDTIHAVILGSAINNDGSAKVGYTAPSIEGQSRAIADAQAAAGIAPETIGYVECHGSGTALGDPIEVSALTRAFATSERGYCPIGSVKSSIGHLGAAAGVAGLIKAVLALEHREIPPSLNFETPNPRIDFASSPFYVNDRLAEWPARIEPRRAGVSSFGLGGTNAHVVLEEAPPPAPTGPAAPWQLLVLSARTETALDAATDRLAEWLERHPEADLADVAHTLQVGRKEFAWRRTLVCRDVAEARQALAGRDPGALRTAWTGGGGRTPVAFLLPGVGDHYPGMARGLYESEPVFRRELDRCLDLLRERSGEDLREVIFSGDRATEGGLDLRRLLGRGGQESKAARRLSRTIFAQPAVFAVEYALAKLWESWGVAPAALLGYSLGEYTAACLAGVFSLEDALTLVAERARWIEELPAGDMLAVSLPEAEVRPRLSGDLGFAAANGPQLTVVSGPPEQVAALAGALAAEGVACRPLPTTHAFHSTMMAPLAGRLTELARTIRLSAPRIPCLSNVTGTWLTAEEATDPGYWARHLCGTVRFSEALEELWKQPSRVLLEVGPGQGLSALALQHPSADGRLALPSLPHAHEGRPDAAFLTEALGRLWLAGVEIDWRGVHGGARRRLPLPTYPFERRRFWIEPNLDPPLVRGGVSPRRREAWLQVPAWRRAALPAGPVGEAPAPWVLAHTPEVAGLVGRLAAAGQAPEKVLLLNDVEDARELAIDGLRSVVVLASGLHELSGGDLLPEHAARLAACRQVAKSHGASCREIDLPPVLEGLDRWAGLLAAEILAGRDEAVAYSPRGHRWVRRLEEARSEGSGLVLAPGGFCLLLGEGALADAAARWLAGAGVEARRSGEPGEGTPLGVIVVAGGEERLLAARDLVRRGAGFGLVLAARGGEPETAAAAAWAELFALRELQESGLPWRSVTFEGEVPLADRAAEALRLAAELGDPQVLVSAATPPQPPVPPGTGAPTPSPRRPGYLQSPYVAPRDEGERRIAGLMESLLGVSDLGVQDSFFELGGHSLLGTRLLTRIRDDMGVELPISALFESPTVAGLAAVVATARQGVEDDLPLVPVPRDGAPPLSFAQERFWFLDHMEAGNYVYNIPLAVVLTGALAVPALAAALSEVVRRHEALRTVFPDHGGEPAQIILPARPHPLPLVDLSGLPAELRAAERDRLLARESRRPFDLAAGPLLRAILVRSSTREHALAVVIHHIIADHWSFGRLIDEVSALYSAAVRGEASPLPELKVQYADYAAWQRRRLTGEGLDRMLDRWRTRLAGAPAALELPTDYPRPAVQTFRGSRVVWIPAASLTEALHALGHAEGVTPFMILLAAYQSLFHRYSGQQDVIVGAPIAGRTRQEIEPLIGVFINTLALRASFAGDPSFRELLARVREATLEAYTLQDLPFEKLVEELKPERQLARPPLFQTMMVFQSSPAGRLDLPGLTLTPLGVTSGAAQFELTFWLNETVDEGLAGSFEYNADLFARDTAERLLRHFERLLSRALAAPSLRVGEIPLLGEEERRQILTSGSGPDVAWAAAVPVHRLVEAQAALTPEAVAVVAGDGELTYRVLDERANQLAHHLGGLGLGPEVAVGVCLERGVNLPVALLAVLKAGGAYVPLDPSYPRERLAFMLESSAAPVVITQEALRDVLPSHQARVVSLDGGAAAVELESAERPAVEADSAGLAYVLYTSGSTGKPKGVQVPHGALTNFLLSMRERPGLTSSDVLLAVTPVSFDIAGLELYLPLISGGRVVVASREEAMDGARLQELLARSGATVMQATPATWRLLVESGWRGDGRLKALCGGEALPEALAEQLLERAGEVWNLYGPTETTVWSTVDRVTSGRRPALGAPIANTQVCVLEPAGEPAPLGVSGELLIGGDGVARGYFGRPDLTAERFVPDPFRGGGARLYRTGDLARFRADGELEFLGRIDFQVKVRGYRIELGEIETVLGRHPAVSQAVVVARALGEGDARLIAYVTPATAGSQDLRAWAGERLPDYMVPAAVVPLDAFPLTPNGKVDRKALPAPERIESAAVYVAPSTPTEEALAALWAEVLRVERVSVRDDFFALGGHSILATRLMFRIRETLGLELPLRVLFEAPTVSRLAAALSARRAGDAFEAPPIVAVPRAGDLPLSFAQERLWFLHQLEPESAAYNIPAAVRLEGRLDAAVLAATLREIVRRHESLRTFFEIRSGRPVQGIAPRVELELPAVDLGGLPAAAREAELRSLAVAESLRPFDLRRAPLLRAALIRLAEDDHALFLTLHHIASDAWSMGVLVREMAALYEAFSQGLPSPLAELPVQYADFAVWQREWLQGEVLEAQVAWWRSLLAGAPVLELATDHPRAALQTYRGADRGFVLPRGTSEGVRALARSLDATPFMVLLAGFESLLHRYTGQDDLTVGTTIANRTRGELEGLIGLLINTLALRADLAGDPSFSGLIARVREMALGAYTHQDVPFEKLVAELQPDRDLSRSPLFQVLFQLHNVPVEAVELPGGLALRPVEGGGQTSKFDLVLNLDEAGTDFVGVLKHNTSLFEPSTAERIVRHFWTLLAGAVANPALPLSRLPLLSDAERQELLEWNATAADYPRDRCLHEHIAEQAARAPEAVAVVYEGEALTYGELDARSERLARVLRGLGAGPETRVGICVERSLEMMVGLLGILKAGAAYVPLDPSYPMDRLAFMLEDSQRGLASPLLLTQRRLLGALPEHAARVVCLDAPWPEVEAEIAGAPDPGHLAYVIFTSGSTGRPKGAMNSHRGIVNRLLWMQEAFGLTSEDRVVQKTPFSFDVSVWELFWPLMVGARLVIARPGGHQDAAYLTELIAAEGVTTIHFVPSMLQVFLEAPGLDRCGSLKRVVASGEALPASLERRFFARLGWTGAGLFNLYGPTEAAVDVTVWACEPDSRRSSVPIGRPIANTRVHLLDRHLQEVPAGVPGELHIGGVQVGRGYLDRPALTAERFIPDPFGGPGDRLYKTGDLARYLTDGAVEFMGRIDHQVKIRGFRIELGEIESALAAYPTVREAVVAARQGASGIGTGDWRLVAYLVPEAGREVDPAVLRSVLAASLPDYMLPSSWVVLEAMPLSPSGKVDRRALPLDERPTGAGPEAVAPRNALESYLASLWSELLGVEAVGIHDDFFAMGGNSITGAVLINRLQERLGEIVHVVVLFDAPTVARMGAHLEREHAAAVSRVFGLTLDGAEEGPGGGRIGEAEIARFRELIVPLAAPAPARKNRRAVFVLSPPRSGSTLLRVMLGGNPKLFSPPELELLGFGTLAERRDAFPGRDSFWLEGALRAIMEIRRCGPDEARAWMADLEERGVTTAELYGLLQEELGDRILVDKTPSYALDLGLLRRAEEVFEEPFYVHLIRHPYGMIHSFEEAKLDQLFFRREHSFGRRELAELIWLVSHRNIADFLASVPAQRQHWVRFEDLVADPERALQELCAALGVDYHPDMAEPYKERPARMTDGLHAESRMLGDVKFHRHSGVDRQTAERWREAYRQDFLGEAAWELAGELGYPVERAAAAAWKPIEPAPADPGSAWPLSFSQERLWVLDRIDPGSPAYNLPVAVRLSGRLDAGALAASLTEVVRRHSVLRSFFAETGDGPVQIVGAAGPVPLPRVDLEALPPAAREVEARRLSREFARLPFDLARGPMVRALLVRFAAGEHAAFFTMHHIASDGWSTGVLIGEVSALYTAFREGRPSPLPALPIQYLDYARWQRGWLTAEVLERELAHWREVLAGIPTLQLPTDRPRPPFQTFLGAARGFTVPAATAAALKTLGQRQGGTLFMVLLAAFAALLQRYSGQDDIAIGSPTANRTRSQLEGLIGFFVNTIVLRSDLSAAPSFEVLLAQVRRTTLAAFAHQELPFEKVVFELQPERNLAVSPLFQVMLALQNAPMGSLTLPGLTLSPFATEIGTAKLDLTLNVFERPGGLAGSLEYNTGLFDHSTVDRLLGHLGRLLEAVAEAPGASVADLPLLSDGERGQLLVEWNATGREVPGGLVHEWIAAWAARAPEAVAVVAGVAELTYQALDARANQLAHHLRRLGVGPEVAVGVCLDRSADLPVALLAVLKAGGAYVPLDPSYPRERLAWMLEDSAAPVVISQEPLRDVLPPHQAWVVSLDTDAPAIELESPEDPGVEADPANLAYVLYTSGSTGRPKGVQVPHGALANFLLSMRERPGLDGSDVMLAVTPVSFDIAGLELYLPLLAGARVTLASREEAQDGARLQRLLADSGATIMQATPATWRVLVESGWKGDRRLKVLCGGEALPESLARQLLERAGQVWNLYGPTETTIWSTVRPVTPGIRPDIGRPIANTQVYVLSGGGSPAPLGVPGELLIGGDGLARGYHGRPDLTAERFVPDPFRAGGHRLYRTGDLARFLPDGRLELLGRIDFQVKVRGFRIELGEIEAVLNRYPAVAQAVVVARSQGEGDAILAAYLVPAPGAGTADVQDVRALVRERLPEYMVPSAFVVLEAFPLTPNGKVDRKALPAPERTAPEAGYVAPSTPTEEAIAALWAEVLKVERVSARASFFELGGHSILATRLMFRIRETLGADLPLRTLFQAPTVADLAAAVAAHRAEGVEDFSGDLPQIEPNAAEAGLPFPLTDVQEAYWIGRSGALELGSVSTHLYFEIDTPELDVARLNHALRRLIDRHGMLRAIVLPDGRQQILGEVPPYSVAVLDVRGLGEPQAEHGLMEVRGRMSHQVLPADRWPLFEIAVSLLDGRVRLHVSLDLLIGDAWSFRILGRELGQLYMEPDLELPRLDLSFRDYVLAEAALRESRAYQRALAYWRERLSTLPPAPALPLARTPAEVESPRFVRRPGKLDRRHWERLKGLASRAGLTPSGVLLAAWTEVLAAWSESPDLTINLTLFNRLPLHSQVDDIVGDFTSVTLLSVERGPVASFEERARRIQGRLWDDLDHRLVSGVRVLRELSRLRGGIGTTMPVVFTSTLNQVEKAGPEEAEEEAAPAAGGWVYGISQTPQVWLDHQVTESRGALSYKWDAVDELFPAGMLDDMFAAYEGLVGRLADGEDAWREPVRDLLPASQLRLLAEYNATAAPVPAGLLHEPFLAQAARRPEAPAVITSARRLTYGQLDRASLVLAHQLRRLGVRPNQLVGIVMEKGWEQVVAALAILRAGGAYLPIDAHLPAERLRYLLERGEAAVALTQPPFADTLDWPAGVARVVVDDSELEGPALEPLPAIQGPEDLAYVIFTSGSTGLPKGVMIDHRGALNTCVDVNLIFDVGPDDRVLALSQLSFDLSVYDIFGLLAAGGALVIPDAGTNRDPLHWSELCAREGVTVWDSVPALMEMLIEYGAGRPGALAFPLRAVTMSGDWIPPSLPDRIRSAFPGVRIVSMGGATEASIWSIHYPIGEVGEDWVSIPYGRPMRNQTFHVLDHQLEPRPVGVPGALYIGGIGLAQGYWRDEERTRASFVVHPRTGERLYRTGDLGRMLPDGNIEFLGRDDFQVKIQGHRIELGEIESALAQHPAVSTAVVTAWGDLRGAKQLAGYVVLKKPGEGVEEALRREDGRAWADLPGSSGAPSLLARRRFHRVPVPLDDLGAVLAALLRLDIEGSPFPKLRYGSAGSLYPVQAYVYAAPGRVEGLPAGAYYYDPSGHGLVLLAEGERIGAGLLAAADRPVFEEAGFAVFLVARMAAITPLYGAQSRRFVALEAGLMAELLAGVAAERGLALSPAAGRLDELRGGLDLEESHEPLLTLLGGFADPDREAPPAEPWAAEAAAAPAAASGPVVSDPIERLRFKNAHHGLRPGGGRPRVELPRPPLSPEQIEALYVARRSYRRFPDWESVPLADLGALLAALPRRDETSLDLLLYVKPGRIEGLPGGTYAYEPVAHRLALLEEGATLTSSLYDPVNRQVFEQAGFALLIVARASSGLDPRGAALEAGWWAQSLETAAPAHRVGLAQMGGLRLDPVRSFFHLEPGDELVHILLGGRIAAEQTRMPAYLAEAAEHHALEDGLGEAPATPARPADVLAAIREHLRGKLPEYMVPTHLMRLDALPLSSNGKVDRKALPEPEALRAAETPSGDTYVAPESDLERVIAGVVAQVLGLPRVGAHDNFFDLGANSVHVVRVHNALHTALGREISLIDMFNHPSVHRLARHLGESGAGAAAPVLSEAEERSDRLREGRDWRKQRLQKRQAERE
ncbi:MAG TPA: amino acid adenylation domain-containing protein [Thermoanaerobaculia bacterium]